MVAAARSPATALLVPKSLTLQVPTSKKPGLVGVDLDQRGEGADDGGREREHGEAEQRPQPELPAAVGDR